MNLIVKGNINFLGKEIPIIEGGFGEGSKVVLAKTIAEIHESELKEINRLINDNIDEFEEGIDIIDLKNSVGSKHSLLELGFNNQSIANSNNIYLLSEQGYMALVSLMRTDKAKELRKQFRREYFAMRENKVASTGNKEADLYTQLMQASMQAISHVLNQNMASIKQDIKEEFAKERDNLKSVITEQEIIHNNQLKEAGDLIHIKSKNTSQLIKLLKIKISSIKGYRVTAKDYHYNSAKERIFRHLKVWLWEDIPTNRYNEVHSIIDSIETIEDIYDI